jgi:hypothetical protein
MRDRSPARQAAAAAASKMMRGSDSESSDANNDDDDDAAAAASDNNVATLDAKGEAKKEKRVSKSAKLDSSKKTKKKGAGEVFYRVCFVVWIERH